MRSGARRRGGFGVARLLGALARGIGQRRAGGAILLLIALFLALPLASYRAGDPSLDTDAASGIANLLGEPGSIAADLAIQLLGLGSWTVPLMLGWLGLRALFTGAPAARRLGPGWRAALAGLGLLAMTSALAAAPPPLDWPLAAGVGGVMGDLLLNAAATPLANLGLAQPAVIAGAILALFAAAALAIAAGPFGRRVRAPAVEMPGPAAPIRKDGAAPTRRPVAAAPEAAVIDEGDSAGMAVRARKASAKPSDRESREVQPSLFDESRGFRLPELALLTKAPPRAHAVDEAALKQNAAMLEGVLAEFGVRGQIDQIRPGPVVTLYELVPAPGVKSARVVALSDDIARSMSVAACRVSVVPGRNAIGIELPNARREMVSLRDLLASAEYEKANQLLPLALGETIGGEPYIVDLAKMPHLLIAGTTGSGKSVGVNAMILSIVYRLGPDDCRFIMIDPKMLELSAYEGIPHLLAPVVTDPKKAIVALKWTVREMEDRYRRMSKIGVRNVASYNERAREAIGRAEHFVRTVQTGFDEKGRPVFEEEKIRPEPMPYLVVVIDEVADLMLVAGKDIEGAVQRLAQMARAAGIHLIMATQRPSVDVITGTIKANFPTRISFQVTSKIDARTIMNEQGAEQLLGMGDMLYMAGGGRVTRLHGPFVSDAEVEAVARASARPGRAGLSRRGHRRAATTARRRGGLAGEDGGADLYDQAVADRHSRPQGLDQLHPATAADRLQPRRLADGAHGKGRRRWSGQSRGQARNSRRAAAGGVTRSGGAWRRSSSSPPRPRWPPRPREPAERSRRPPTFKAPCAISKRSARSRGRFEQTDAHGRVETGSFLLQRPDKARFDYDAPVAISVISDGHKAFIVNPRLRQLQSAPLSMTPLGIFLARRIRLDRGGRVTSVHEHPAGFEVTVVAPGSPARGSITLDFNRPPLALAGWTITTGAGGGVRVRIVKLGPAAPKPEAFFDAHRRAAELELP